LHFYSLLLSRWFRPTPGRVAIKCLLTTLMSDRLWTGKPSRYLSNHQGQLSLPSLRSRLVESSAGVLEEGACSTVSGGRQHSLIPHRRWPYVL